MKLILNGKIYGMRLIYGINNLSRYADTSQIVEFRYFGQVLLFVKAD
jgi:hypothetical protein